MDYLSRPEPKKRNSLKPTWPSRNSSIVFQIDVCDVLGRVISYNPAKNNSQKNIDIQCDLPLFTYVILTADLFTAELYWLIDTCKVK